MLEIFHLWVMPQSGEKTQFVKQWPVLEPACSQWDRSLEHGSLPKWLLFIPPEHVPFADQQQCFSGAECYKGHHQHSSRVGRLGWPWEYPHIFTCPSGRDQFLVYLSLLNIQMHHVFVKLISCCLWASLKCLIPAWVLAMKLSSAFTSAGLADELPKLGPSHCCDHAAGRTRWPPFLADI